LGGGKFYVQTVGDQKIASIQNQLASLNLKDAPVIGAFNPKKGDIVLCYFHADSSWYRAMVSSNMIFFFFVAFSFSPYQCRHCNPVAIKLNRELIKNIISIDDSSQ
jgi:hypothetical protein